MTHQSNDLVSRLTLAAQGEGASDFTPQVHFTLLLEARDEIDRLRDALVKSVAVVQGWHNMGLGKSASILWDIYWRSSPEMKPIREALTALKEVSDASR